MLRAYVRDRVALFFSLFVPLMLMVLFGSLNLGAFGRVNAIVADEARSEDSARFIAVLEEVPALRLERADREAALRELRRTEADLLLVIPADFRLAPGGAPARVELYANDERPQQVAAGRSLINEVIARLSFALTRTGPVVAVDERRVEGVRLRYVDFLVPGILGLNLMQLAIFSTAFALVVDKQRGVLRRIMATPLRPRRFLSAHVIVRLLLAAAQVAVLLGVALVLFDVRVVGSVVALFAVALLGSLMFLTQGFALAGWARTENQVPAVANLLTLPQFFLSGVFFPKEAAPELIRPLTALLPLTFLNDALREISVQGATLWDVRVQLLGLVAWALVGFVLAVRLFRFRT